MGDSQTKKHTISYINVVKGFGIILVVFGHALNKQIRNSDFFFKYIWEMIYSFHMPLFFVISGYLYWINYKKYQEKGNKVFIKKKFQLLMVPYFVICTLNYAFLFVMQYVLGSILHDTGYSVGTFPQFLIALTLFQGNVVNHLWFVYSLFLCFLAAVLLKDKIRDFRFVFLFAVFYTIVSYLFNIPEKFELLDRTMYHFIYFALGTQVELIETHIRRKLGQKALFAIGLGSVYSLAIMGVINFQNNTLLFWISTSLLHYPTAILFVLVIFGFGQKLCDKYECKFLSLVGKRSYEIYLLHAPFLVTGSSMILYGTLKLPAMIVLVVSTCIGIVIPLMVSSLIIRKSKLLSFFILGNRTVSNHKN